jgi:hypothetical protein
MKVAITIGSFMLPDFVELNIRQCQRVFPGAPILVSDDLSARSEEIASIGSRLGATCLCANSRRGHFAGDFMAILNSISFAQAHECELAVKVSQRFIFRREEASGALLKCFDGTAMSYGLPGRIAGESIRPGGSMGFALMPVMTDLMVFRVSDCDPEAMSAEYKAKVANEWGTPTGTYIEAIANDWAYGRFKDRTVFMEEFSGHVNGRPGGDLYLRRNQNHHSSYLELARENGLRGDFRLDEWVKLEGRGYYPRPRAL